MANVATGASRIVLREEDPTWINVSGEPRFLTGGDRFSLDQRAQRSSVISMFTALTVDGKLQKQLTSGDWEVNNIAGVDEEHQRVYYTSTAGQLRSNASCTQSLLQAEVRSGLRKARERIRFRCLPTPFIIWTITAALRQSARRAACTGPMAKQEREYRAADRKAFLLTNMKSCPPRS